MSGVMRADTALRPDTPEPGQALGKRERMQLESLAAITGMQRGSPEFLHAQESVVAFSRTYTQHRTNTMMHALPGALLLLLAPLQFSKRIRNRYRTFHRWLGRALLLLIVSVGATAFYFGLFTPFAGPGESVAVVIFGGLFTFSALRAYIAIRRRDIERHREWMIRMFALAIGISTVRVVNLALLLVFVGQVRETFVPSLFLGFGVTLLFAEYWIRRTRPRRASIQRSRQEPAYGTHTFPVSVS